jgi:hypothetical protein
MNLIITYEILDFMVDIESRGAVTIAANACNVPIRIFGYAISSARLTRDIHAGQKG